MISLAKVLKPHGLDGAVKVSPIFYEFNFKKLKNVYFYDKSQRKSKLTIKYVKNLNNFYILKFNEINSPEEAENLKNKELLIEREEYIDLLKNILILTDLIGLNVVDDSTGEILGVVTEVEDYGAKPIITLSNSGLSYMVPFVDEIIRFSKSENVLKVNKKRFDEVKI